MNFGKNRRVTESHEFQKKLGGHSENSILKKIGNHNIYFA